MRQLISSRSATWVRWLLVLVACLYFGLGLGLLGLRYVVLPQIDHWRPQIEHRLADRLGVQVRLGALHADWHGWDPILDVQGLSLSDASGYELLSAPSVQARLNWRALLPGHRGLLRLRVTGMDLDVSRLPDGRVSLLGLSFDPGEAAPVALPPWLQWVLSQPLIAFHDVTVRWRDQNAPPLSFDEVSAVWVHDTTRGASLQASARARAAGDARVQLRAVLDDLTPLIQGEWPAHARAWLHASQITPLAWQHWVSGMPTEWRQGMLDLQAWAEISNGTPRLTVQGRIESLDWAGAQNANLRVPTAVAWAQGSWAQWHALTQAPSAQESAGGAGTGSVPGIAFEARAQGVQLFQPQWFASVLDLGALSARGRLQRAADWRLQIDRASWHNADADLDAQGTWRSNAGAGIADLSGTITRARMGAIHRYLPLVVNADAREWLATGLQAGELVDANWLLRGDLAEFPFGDRPQAGDFRITGDFRGARIDLVPDIALKQSWPLLQIPAGHVDLHRMDLNLRADQATMAPSDKQVIAMKALQARIPDMEHEPVLSVSGQTSAPAAAYLALIQRSPLGGMLSGVFDEARVTGDWQVPLAITVPLLHSHDAQVQGRVDVQRTSLQFLPQAPAFQDLEGQVHFSETGVRIVQPLKGRLLGGPVQVLGDLGDHAGPGLSFHGQMSAAAIGHFAGVPGMKRITGTLAYQARLSRQKRGYLLNLDSDTSALALDFPAPLSKPQGEARTLNLQWSDADPSDDTLEIRYGSGLRVDLRHARSGSAKGPYFQQAAIGLGQAATLAPGLQVAVDYPLFDLDVWNRIVDEFSIVRRGQVQARGGHTAKRPLWPDLALLSVQADQLRLLGTRLDHSVLRVVKSADERWSMNVRSLQTTGTLKWQERDGRVQGKMSARFSRLSLGDDPRDNNALLPDAQIDEDAAFDDDLEISGILLQADDFRLYGRPVGALSLEGERDGVQHVWHLRNLRIGDGQTRLAGSGTWRLRGDDRGLTLNASVKTEDLGAWMDRAGWKDVMVGGKGDLKGRFEWRDLPWTHDKVNLRGDLKVSLDKGRFPKLGSHTAKLLEFLSLQSIARLTKLDSGLAGLLHEGVPFDQLRGSVSLNQGVAQVHDYKLIGSVGTILLEGTTNIMDQTFNMQAVVVPNLDVSGAAIAAGIAINPIIGLGAFITQWLLKTPLAKVMTSHYQITGTWDDPKVQDVPVAATATIAPDVH
ncbi:MAG: TIGR02099 family protein [Castellaniella sp.]|uniref:YhdP family protein n=1 Tax=Castellaniella sp. TaxID=1955812 RepID=UPI00120A6A75|nr:YhdP family protein [Castellaniella sp.]TAN29934.1 MAG: TIGR02099 family protein [Castellaniella sp.]